MACSSPSWRHARNATTLCPHPAITSCAECEQPLCSAHIVECDVCGRFLCSECSAEHSHEVQQQQHTQRVAA